VERRATDPVLAGPCPPAADLTAWAHDELPQWRRAETARHLLRCARCRETADAAARVFERLAALGAGGEGWREDVAAARRARALSRLRLGGALAASLAVAAVGATLWSGGEDGTPSPAAAEAAEIWTVAYARSASPDERALLAAQRPDGRWEGEASEGLLRHDEAATGLALLALASQHRDDLADGDAGRATAAGTAFLRTHLGDDGRFGRGTSARDHAVATAGLLAVLGAADDPTLRAAADRAVRALARLVRDDGALDDAGSRWALSALARARDLGWDRLEAPLRRLEPAAGRAEAGTWLAATPPRDGGAPTAVARALRLLASPQT
jgi:hypothetical protein